MKLQKKIKWIVYKINDEGTKVVVDTSSESADWEPFREVLVNAKALDKNVCLKASYYGPSADKDYRKPRVKVPDMLSTTSTTIWPTERDKGNFTTICFLWIVG